MTAEELKKQIVRELGRPEDDDRYPDDDLTSAARESERSIKREFAKREHARRIILEDLGPISAADSAGATYTLGETPIYLELYTPPGWNGGYRLLPARRGASRRGFFLTGKTIRLTRPYVYTPGLYVYGIFATAPTNLAQGTFVDSSLPEALHVLQAVRAARMLAQRPHSRVNVADIKAKEDGILADIIESEVFAVPGTEWEEEVDGIDWWNSPDLGPS